MHRQCWVDETTGWLPRIDQAGDPVALGVHAALLGSVGRMPAYVARDVDQHLDRTLSGGGFALLVGDSTSGKSRAAYEAMRRLPGTWSLLVPRDGRALRELLDDGLELKEAVVWLDDLERYLGPGGLDPALLRRMRGDGNAMVAIVATMRSNEFHARLPAAGRPGAVSGVLEADQQVLLAGRRIDIGRSLSPAELSRAGVLTGDARIAGAIRHGRDFGLGEYLADGPRLWRRWRHGLRDDAPGAERAGAALVAAAVDMRRAGMIRPIEPGVLRELAPLYLTGGTLDDDLLSAGLDWATDAANAPSGLLRRQVGGLTSFDYLLDRTQLDQLAAPVPGAIWQRLVRTTHPDDAWHIGMAAYWSGRLDFAEGAFRAGLAAADPAVVARAALGLSEVASLLDQFIEAREWLRLAARTAAGPATPSRAGALQQRDDLVRSERWYRRFAGIEGAPHEVGGGQLVVDHEHAAMDYVDGRYVQDTSRRLVNQSDHTIDRYPIRIAVDRFPDDADHSRMHYLRHPLRVADLRLWAECDGRAMTWEVGQDLPNFKEIWLLFEDADGRFPLTPGAGVDLRYGYAVADELWGPWSQRPVRVPTRRLSVRFSFPDELRPQLRGSETALRAQQTPLLVAQDWDAGRSVFTWETRNPPLNSRFRFDWDFGAPPAAPAAPLVTLAGRPPAPLDASAMSGLVRRFCELGAALPGRQDALRADPAALPGVEWQLEQDMLAALRDTLGPAPVLAEEYHHRFGTPVSADDRSRIRVVLDPLDGSDSFMRGESTYACTFAVWVDDRLTFGVVYQPAEERVYWALRGQPPMVGDDLLRPVPAEDPRTVSIKSTVARDPFVIAARRRLGEQGYAFEHVESSALKLCWIAEGRRAGLIKRIAAGGDLLLEWGVAAGMLIGHQAGCQIRDWNGEVWRRTAGGLLAGDARLMTDLTA